MKVGLGWYREDQWSLLREVSEDVEKIENTYFEWVVNANEAIHNLERIGHKIVKVDIDVNELIDWCKKENTPINGESRSKFISMKTKTIKR